MSEQKAEEIAREIINYVQEAVGEIANDMLSPQSGFLDKDWKRKIAKAKKAGCDDLAGWLADELYNDPNTLSSLMGDRIHDAVGGRHNNL